MSIYKTSPNNPVHLSIAALVIDNISLGVNAKIYCHYFNKISKFENLFRFFVESIETNESVE